MNKIKKSLRLMGYVILIILGSLGVGLVGGAPIPTINRKQDQIELASESQESQNVEDSEFQQIK